MSDVQPVKRHEPSDPPTEPAESRQRGLRDPNRRRDRYHMLLLLAILIIEFVLLTALRPDAYPTARNLTSMAFQMSEIGLLALAVACAMLIGGIDLSIVAVANLSGIVAAKVMTALAPEMGGTALVVATGCALGVGLVAGAVNGLLVSLLRVSPIVVTLGTMTLFTGVATGVTGGSTVFAAGEFASVGAILVAGVPLVLLVLVLAAVALTVATRSTRWGFRVYTVGASEKVSRYARLPVERVQVSAYLISGSLSALAGLVTLSRTDSISVGFGSSYLILAILVAVLAGVSPYGGVGRLLAVPVAMAVMQQVSTGLNMALAGAEGANFAKEFAWGAILILVLAVSEPRTRQWLRELVAVRRV
ncbi:ABC transporter permease [Actinobacteria bacterium YIM 96077]|uniref:ABC transporter permease n=1 Tax=Phytoactinopolyspora halophila TaxID=1981511 RepID=A0A329QPL0_9ACTN|nr:ABC transporter permease [Phytoactinopolyspora halophila]AYY12262.1 ABC transporter permease [Actinobacteria bacterium YIM 96077]RAW13821.1 ABC transporter permease [Phytoactinopolyspora halophila]